MPIIGLEVHVELETESKMFCDCPAYHFQVEPNKNTCPVCLGLPGALPVPNQKAIDWTLKIGMALNCKINRFSKFDRKNYFYPDLAKGYQISQYDIPFCYDGSLAIQTENGEKKVGIERVHLEEDTGKLLHRGEASLIDFNRSGVPLVEIVTKPDLNSTAEAIAYLRKLQQTILYLNVSSAAMDKGSMRLEPNISLKKPDEKGLPGYKVEVKNINSFRFVKSAIEKELKRQKAILDSGKMPAQETRGFNEETGNTFSQRNKEQAADYRYFPEPDIPPIRITKEKIMQIKDNLPVLPNEKLKMYIKKDELSQYQAEILIKKIKMGTFFDKTKELIREKSLDTKYIQKAAKQIINKKIDIGKIDPEQLINKLVKKSEKPELETDRLKKILENVIKENPEAVEDYKKGKKEVIGFLIGQTMQKIQGKASPKRVKRMLVEKLSNNT